MKREMNAVRSEDDAETVRLRSERWPSRSQDKAWQYMWRRRDGIPTTFRWRVSGGSFSNPNPRVT